MARHDEIAIVREEIRRAGRAVVELRRRTLRPGVLWAGLGLAVGGAVVAALLGVSGVPALLFVVVGSCGAIPLLPIILGIVFLSESRAKTRAQRAAGRQQLVERLRSLPEDQLAAALMPLRSDAEREVRALAHRLLCSSTSRPS